MHSTKLPKLPAPYRFPEGTAYTALREFKADGVQFQRGDPLPADLPLRTNPRRIEMLVRLRWIAPVTEAIAVQNSPKKPQPQPKSQPQLEPEIETQPEPEEEPAMVQTEATPDISQMTGPQLIRKCRDLGLKVTGNKNELRKRLRDALG